jgi:hypothetical protein
VYLVENTKKCPDICKKPPLPCGSSGHNHEKRGIKAVRLSTERKNSAKLFIIYSCPLLKSSKYSMAIHKRTFTIIAPATRTAWSYPPGFDLTEFFHALSVDEKLDYYCDWVVDSWDPENPFRRPCPARDVVRWVLKTTNGKKVCWISSQGEESAITRPRANIRVSATAGTNTLDQSGGVTG